MQTVEKTAEINEQDAQQRSVPVVLKPTFWLLVYIAIFGILGLPRLKHPLQEVRETDECTFGSAGFDFIRYGWPSEKIPNYKYKFWKSGSITTEFFISLPMRLGLVYHDGLEGLQHPDPALRWRLYPWARSISLLFALVSIVFAYLIGIEIFKNRHVALFAPLLLYLNPDLLLFSKLVRGDVPGLATSLVSAWFCLRYLKKGQMAQILFAAFFVGVSTSFKFNYLFTCSFPAIAWIIILVKRPEGITIKSLALTAVLAPLAAILGLLVSNPFIIFDPSGYHFFVKWVLSLASKDKITASIPLWQLLCGWHFLSFIRFAYGLALAILFCVGVASFALFSRRRAYLFILVSLLVYYFAMVFSGNQQQASEHRQSVISIALAVYLILLPIDLLVSRVTSRKGRPAAAMPYFLTAIFVLLGIGQFTWKIPDRDWWDPFHVKGASRAISLACFKLIEPGSSLVRTNVLTPIAPFYEHWETRYTKMLFNTYTISTGFVLEPAQADRADYLFIREINYPDWEEDFDLLWKFVDYKKRDTFLLKNRNTDGAREKIVNPFTQAELWRTSPPLFENGNFERPEVYPPRHFGMLTHARNIWGSGLGKYVGRVEVNVGREIEASLSQVLPFSRKHLAEVIYFNCLFSPHFVNELGKWAVYLDLKAYTFSQMLLAKKRYLLCKAKHYPNPRNVKDISLNIVNDWRHVRIDARKDFLRDWNQVDFLKVSLTVDSPAGEPVIFFVDNFRSEYEPPEISSSDGSIQTDVKDQTTTGPLQLSKGWWDEIHTPFDEKETTLMMEDFLRASREGNYEETLRLARNLAFLFPENAWVQRHVALCMLRTFRDAVASYNLISLACALLPNYPPFQSVLHESWKGLNQTEPQE